MLPIKKNYIDTRQRTADSASHSDFSIDLPTTVLMPDDTGFYVEDICLPISWWSIEEGYNDTLFMDFESSFKQVQLIPGNYSATGAGAEIIRAINSTSTTAQFAFFSENRRAQSLSNGQTHRLGPTRLSHLRF